MAKKKQPEQTAVIALCGFLDKTNPEYLQKVLENWDKNPAKPAPKK